MAPLNTAKSYLAESVYSAFELVKLARELSDDPKEVIFGDYLTARDVIRQQLIDLYKDIGVDHAYGFAVKRTMLRDLRPDRVDQYPARRRFAKYDRQTSNIRAYADTHEVQTVSHNNHDLVSRTGSGTAVAAPALPAKSRQAPSTAKRPPRRQSRRSPGPQPSAAASIAKSSRPRKPSSAAK